MWILFSRERSEGKFAHFVSTKVCLRKSALISGSPEGRKCLAGRKSYCWCNLIDIQKSGGGCEFSTRGGIGRKLRLNLGCVRTDKISCRSKPASYRKLKESYLTFSSFWSSTVAFACLKVCWRSHCICVVTRFSAFRSVLDDRVHTQLFSVFLSMSSLLCLV